jgi:cysteine-rich repeat protein
VSFFCDELCGNGVREAFCCEPCDAGGDCEIPCLGPCTPTPCRCELDTDTVCDEDADCPGGQRCLCAVCNQLCGNFTIDERCCEECDEGPMGAAECSPECRAVECNPRRCECAAGGGGCLADADCAEGDRCVCIVCDSLCGNGVLDTKCCEECDDGTRLDGDGCSATCKAQPCCVPQPLRCAADRSVPCDDGEDCVRAGVGGPCAGFRCDTLCGDGRLDPGCCEQCDDGRQCYGYPKGIASDGDR